MSRELTIEELEILSKKVYASTKDIQLLGNIGYNKARKIREEIREELADKGWVLPKYDVPMSNVIDKLPQISERLEQVGGAKHGRK